MTRLQVEQRLLTISYDCLKNVGDDWEFFFKNKKPNEILGIGSVPLSEVFLVNTPIEFYKRYLESGRFINHDLTKGLKDLDTHFYQSHLELFPKLVWLLNDYLKDRKFKNPVGLLYNPTLNLYEIHPGGSRQILFNLFKPEEIEGLIFSPERPWLKKEDFKVTFNSKEEVLDYFKKDDIQVALTPDKGTLIPHIHFDITQLEGTIINYHLRLKEYFDQTYFHFPQFNHNWKLYFNTPNKENRVDIILEDKVKDSPFYQLIGLAAACLGKNIKLDGIEIQYYGGEFQYP
jgi:hypothetical protein